MAEQRASRDRQELWHLESFLSVNGTTKTHRERRLRLYRYLCETCDHEWSDVSGWGGCPKGTFQCDWCSRPVFPDDPDRQALLAPTHDRAVERTEETSHG